MPTAKRCNTHCRCSYANGAIAIALGHYNVGAFTNKQAFLDRLLAAARTAGEKMWQLPMDEEYKEYLKSAFADLPNIGGRYGGSITAAWFLKEFADPTPWVHLDIASTAWLDDAKPWMAKGPSGVASEPSWNWRPRGPEFRNMSFGDRLHCPRFYPAIANTTCVCCSGGGCQNAASSSCVCAGRRKGTRLYPLTKERAKPAVPFGGRYRIVDFVLSNLVNSGIYSIYVLTQFKSQSLLQHLREGWEVSGPVEKSISSFRFPPRCDSREKIGIAARPTPFTRTST